MGRIQFVMLARVTWADTKQDIGLTNLQSYITMELNTPTSPIPRYFLATGLTVSRNTFDLAADGVLQDGRLEEASWVVASC